MKNIFPILFLVVGFLTVLEFIFIAGMFTWIIMVISICIIGLINISIEIKNRQYLQAILYLLAITALVMGYLKLV
ncbi:hypothetical protein FQ087_12825 [Sporosarcina sp. ANT_H38]|uniref:hypothetical protein n=1 Tax=Sporosarcina sp. ANT_H38 TaxID=2597358 RepID=UPI0011F1A088|nr:hypothetical protein [Sporosarcina sp. ANT_H38]KAA0955490.1 hypothetical protein FQ087_12825 [Sporosarcina sp. ANT_H38]